MTGSATRAALQRGDESAAPQRAPRRGELAGAVSGSLGVIALSPDTMAVGDGANDLAMLGAAGLGVAYRAKPVVAAAARSTALAVAAS